MRRQKAADTRERIVEAGVDLVRSGPLWDWAHLTVRAAAQRAGVNERTVYRHFTSESGLQRAVMDRLTDRAGLSMRGMRLADVAAVARETTAFAASFPRRSASEPHSTPEADTYRREALLAAVRPAAPDWSDADHEIAAAMLDVLWDVFAYERLANAWDLDPEAVTRGITWVIRLVEEAVREGRPPSTTAG